MQLLLSKYIIHKVYVSCQEQYDKCEHTLFSSILWAGEGGRRGGRKGGREGGGRKREREREGGREEERERGREGGREGGRKREGRYMEREEEDMK